jgi:hypothetical protein
MGLVQLLTPASATEWLNGLYWVLLPLLPVINGISVIRQLRRRASIQHLVLPIIAAFYSVVSIHYQIPIYLYYSAGICLAAVLWQQAIGRSLSSVAHVVLATLVVAVAIGSHAGQSYRRHATDILQGARRPLPAGGGLDRASLNLDRHDMDTYGALVSLIRSHAPPGATILAIPSDAELYFLSDRRNPFSFYNTALGIRTTDDLAHVLETVRTEPPHVVTFRPDDKYNTTASRQIMEVVRMRYHHVETVSGV